MGKGSARHVIAKLEAQAMGTVPPNVKWFVEVLAGTY
jgi:hypothetical protein